MASMVLNRPRVIVSPEKTPYQCVVTGQLKHPNDVPFRNQECELKIKGNWFQKTVSLGVVTTDHYGNFSFKFEAHKWPSESSKTAYLYIYENALAAQGYKMKIAGKIPLSLNLNSKRNNMGDVIGRLYEVDKAKGLSLLASAEDDGEDIPGFSIRDIALIASSAIETKLKQFALDLVEPIVPMELVQWVFTGKYSSMDLSSEIAVDMILNWLGSAALEPGAHPGQYLLKCNWDNIPRDEDTTVSYPNVVATLEKVNGNLVLVENALEFKKGEVRTYKPGDKDFISSLYLTTSGCFYKAEVEHLGRYHLIPELIATAAGAVINLNPVKEIFDWIFDGVHEINKFGASVIFSKEKGVFGLAPFTEEGINTTLAAPQRNFCYKHYGFDEAIADNDNFAKYKQCVWENVLDPFVNWFTNENEIKILTTWVEIESMSYNLLDFCQPFQALNGNPNSKEIDNRTDDRVIFNGEVKSVRPIENIKDLNQFLKTSIWLFVFGHSWVHLAQDEFARNLKIASLAPRLEADDLNKKFGGTTFEDGTKELEIAKILIEAPMRRLLENKFENIPPYFLELLQKAAPKLLAIGFDVKKLYPGVII